MPVILASGSRDGSIRLWDIRKSGSRACITVLNQEGREKVTTTTTSCSYKADYSHLRIPDGKKQKKDNKKRKLNDQQQQKQKQLDGAPNNYHSNQNTIMIFLLCLIIPLGLTISFGLIGKDFLGVFVSKIFSMLIVPIETAFISSVYLFLKNKKNQDEVINS